MLSDGDSFRTPVGARNAIWMASALLLGCLGIQGSSAVAQSDANALPERNGAFRLSLQTNASKYTVNEPINLRVIITNVSRDHFRFQVAPTFYLVALLIRDAEGTIQRSPGITALVRLDSHYWDAPSGTSIEPGWKSEDDPTGTWINLNLWGYTLPAGTYTIEGVPRFSAYLINEDNSLGTYFKIARVPSSNVVTITITERHTVEGGSRFGQGASR